MKLVVVSAGLSVPSSTRLLGDRLANATAERTSADVQVVELRDLAVEIAHNFTTGFPGPALGAALDAVTSADGLIVVTPVFSASYSGLFKSFFDVLDPDALTGKPVLVAATGVGPSFAGPGARVAAAVRVSAGRGRAHRGVRGFGGLGAEGLVERIDRAAGELARLMNGLAAGRSGSVPVSVPTQGGVELVRGGGFEVVPFEQQLAALRPE